LAGVICLATLNYADAEDVSFRSDVAPILVKRCLTCHGEQKFKGEYQLHTFETLMAPGETDEASIVPGKPEESYLFQLINDTDAGVRMPKDADRLSDEEIDLVRRWIAAGAKFDGADSQASMVTSVVWKHRDPPDTYPRPFPVTALAFSPDGKELAASGHHEITIWNAEDGSLIRRISGVAERTYSLAYNNDGSLLASAAGTPGQLGEIKILNPRDGSLVRHFGSQTDCALSVSFSSDGNRLAAGGADHRLRIFDVASGKQELLIDKHSDWVMGVAFSPDGSKLASASRDKTAKVFDAKTGELLLTYSDHGATVHAVAFNNDGSQAISCDADKRIHVWHPTDQGYEDKEMKKQKRQQIGTIGGFGGEIFAMTFAEGQVFACSADQTARQFDVEKRNQIRQYSGHEQWLFAVAYSAATKRLAAAGLDGEVRIWNTQAKHDEELDVITFVAAPGYVPAEATAQAGGE
jgi:WD40 repeat protein